MTNALAYIGSGLLIVAPFMGANLEAFIIAGFIFLTPQAAERRLWNLFALNLVGIFSYLWRII